LQPDDVQQQGTVLVSVAEVLQNGQPVKFSEPSRLVRLVPLDDCAHDGPPDTFYLSFVTGQIVLLGGAEGKYWELGMDIGLAALTDDKRADEIVEARPNLLDSLAGQDRETHRNRTITEGCAERFCRLRITADNGSLVCFSEESVALRFELLDVLLGPV
jgi:hypothetical protein